MSYLKGGLGGLKLKINGFRLHAIKLDCPHKKWRHISQIWTYGLIICWIERVSIWFIHHWITSINKNGAITSFDRRDWRTAMLEGTRMNRPHHPGWPYIFLSASENCEEFWDALICFYLRRIKTCMIKATNPPPLHSNFPLCLKPDASSLKERFPYSYWYATKNGKHVFFNGKKENICEGGVGGLHLLENNLVMYMLNKLH